MGSAARSSRMSITFQKNFWGLVVPEPWSSKTSSDEVSPNCAAAAEAPVAARATKRAINAAEVFIFVCIRMVVRLLRLVGSCGGSVGSVERSKKNLQGLVFQTSCAFVATRYDPCSKPLKQYATCFSLFQSTRRGSVLALAVAKTDEISDCRDIRFKYAITSEIDGCIQSRFRVCHLLEAVKKSRVSRLFPRSPFTTSRGLPRPPESRFSHSQRRFTMASKRITKELQVRARTNVAPAAIATRP